MRPTHVAVRPNRWVGLLLLAESILIGLAAAGAVWLLLR